MTRERLIAGIATALAALALAGGALAGSIVIVILGPRTPDARSTAGMRMTVKPRVAPAGTEFRAVASRFAPGEYVAVWSYRGRHSSQLNGGTASGRGRLAIYPQSAAGISGGRYKICAQGLRTKRVACGSYRVTRTSLQTDPSGDPVAPQSDEGSTAPQSDGEWAAPQSDGDWTSPTSDGDWTSPTSG